jgi:hypothetical protein
LNLGIELTEAIFLNKSDIFRSVFHRNLEEANRRNR